MDDVIENCHNTFEEDGVSQQTLEDLKTVSRPALALQSFGFILILWFPPKSFHHQKHKSSFVVQMIRTLFAAASIFSFAWHRCGRDHGIAWRQIRKVGIWTILGGTSRHLTHFKGAPTSLHHNNVFVA